VNWSSDDPEVRPGTPQHASIFRADCAHCGLRVGTPRLPT
jgi:hypothetical protein